MHTKLQTFLKKIIPELNKTQHKIKQTDTLLLSIKKKWPTAKLTNKQSILSKIHQQLNTIKASTNQIHTTHKHFTQITNQFKHI